MPHEKLQPLRDLQSDPKETLNILKQTKEELNIVENEAAEAAKIELDAVLAETKENIAAATDIEEAEVLVLIDAVIKDLGGYMSREELMNDLGLKGTVDNTEFLKLDTKGEGKHVISEAELLEEVSASGGTAEEGEGSLAGFDKNVTSVFEEYVDEFETAVPPVKSIEQLKIFLEGKMTAALVTLNEKYAQQTSGVEQPASNNSYKNENQGSGTGSGALGSLGALFEDARSENTELEKFHNALLIEGSISENVEKVMYTEGNARKFMQESIDEIIAKMQEPGSKTFEQYEAVGKAPETKLGKDNLRVELLEGVPENFQGGEFEEDYEDYMQKCLADGKRPKNFNTWLDERPKPGGLMGTWDYIKELFAKSGLGKILRDLFGKDSWISNIFGSKEEAEMDEEDEKEMKEAGIKNPAAWEIKKNLVEIEELSKPEKWNGVKIEGFLPNDGVELTENELQLRILKLSAEDKDVLKNVLNASASENSVLVMARAMTFDLPLLTKLDGIKGNIEHKAGENSFTLNDDPSKTPYTITVDGITKAANDVATLVKDAEGFAGHEEQVEDVSNWSEDAFAGSERIFANLQPALKGLLKLDAKYWEEFKLDKAKVEKFLDAMVGTGSMVYTSKFKNEEGAFKADGTSFLVKKGGGWLNSEKDENYTTVKSFFETL